MLTWRYRTVAGEMRCPNWTVSVGARVRIPSAPRVLSIIWLASDLGKQVRRPFWFFVLSGHLVADTEQHDQRRETGSRVCSSTVRDMALSPGR